MNAAEMLSMVGQLGMSLTGFAGLLIAFRFRTRQWKRVEIYAVRLLLASSTSACAFALIPLPFLDGDSGDRLLWDLCLGALGCWLLALGTHYLWARYCGDLQPRYPRTAWVIASTGLITGLVLLLGALDIISIAKPRLYVFGLYWLLATATLQLIMQVMASLRSVHPD
jgi:hypothetical protein